MKIDKETGSIVARNFNENFIYIVHNFLRFRFLIKSLKICVFIISRINHLK